MESKERFFNALYGKPVDRVPVFPLLMFLSARHAGITYREFVTDAHAMAEAQLLMLEKFGMDAITACTDAFRVPADLGGDITFPEEGTPYLSTPLVTTEADFLALRRPHPDKGRMADRVKGISMMVNSAGNRCAILGWVEMPYAEASSVVGLADFMMLAMSDSPLAHRILSWLTDIEIEFALAQIDAGADMIGAGDAAASLISPQMYREFALPYEQRVIEAIHSAGKPVKLHICGNTEKHLPDMAKSGADLFNVDHMVDFDAARDVYSASDKCFKGNLDPVVDILQATPEHCMQIAHARIRGSQGHRYMLSAGCEVPRDVSDEVFTAFCDAPKVYAELSSKI